MIFLHNYLNKGRSEIDEFTSHCYCHYWDQYAKQIVNAYLDKPAMPAFNTCHVYRHFTICN